MPTTIDAARPILELVYFGCGSFLALGVFLTYRQLLVMKKDADDRAARAAAEKAVEASDRYLCKFVPIYNRFCETLRTAGVPVEYDGPVEDFSAKSLGQTSRNNGLEPDATNPVLQGIVETLNELQLIAAYFATGVADEAVGFKIIGRTYCNTVERNYDFVSFVRTRGAAEHWSSIVDLYQVWRPRLQEEELEAQVAGYLDQLKTLRSNKAHKSSASDQYFIP